MTATLIVREAELTRLVPLDVNAVACIADAFLIFRRLALAEEAASGRLSVARGHFLYRPFEKRQNTLQILLDLTREALQLFLALSLLDERNHGR